MSSKPDVNVEVKTCPRCHEPNLIPVAVPEGAGLRCWRCDNPLRPWSRSLHNNRLAALFAAAGLLFYIPAVTLPLMGIERFGFVNEVGLIEGVIQLVHHGNPVLGLILLICSVFLPLIKLVGLLLLSTHGPALSARRRSALFHLIEYTGRFSLLDVLLVAVLIAVVKVGDLVTVYASAGLFAFTLVVFLSLMAAWSFDQDEIWKERHAERR